MNGRITKLVVRPQDNGGAIVDITEEKYSQMHLTPTHDSPWMYITLGPQSFSINVHTGQVKETDSLGQELGVTL